MPAVFVRPQWLRIAPNVSKANGRADRAAKSRKFICLFLKRRCFHGGNNEPTTKPRALYFPPTSARPRPQNKPLPKQTKTKKGVEHEATEAFFSEGGRARTKAQIDQREDCFVLKEGLGAAFLVEPAAGTLPPWGVATVAVTVFNDTPGRYTDKVDITFTGAPPPPSLARRTDRTYAWGQFALECDGSFSRPDKNLDSEGVALGSPSPRPF